MRGREGIGNSEARAALADPMRFDGEIRAAAAALGRGLSALAEAPEERLPNPLARHRISSSRATFEALGERRAAGELLAGPMRTWVYALTLERVLWEERVALARALSVEEPDPLLGERASVRMLRRRLLAEPAEGRRRELAGALARIAGPARSAALRLAERRDEARAALGASDEEAAAFELPCRGEGRGAAEIAEAAALATLARLEEAALALSARTTASFADALALSVGREAERGWPAKLTPRWAPELFRGTRLLEGISFEPRPAPEPLGASSFARALGRVGEALALAGGKDAPFSRARRPFDLRRARRASLFAFLVADPVFGMRALGLSRAEAEDQARLAARALLVTLRLDAARLVVSRKMAARGAGDRFEELTAEALGAPVPASLLGVLPVLGPGDGVRFLGSLLAALDRRALVERFDEDWFRNPRAAEAIRDEDATLDPLPAFPSSGGAPGAILLLPSPEPPVPAAEPSAPSAPSEPSEPSELPKLPEPFRALTTAEELERALSELTSSLRALA